MQLQTLLLPLMALTGALAASLPETAPSSVIILEDYPAGFEETLSELEALVAAESDVEARQSFGDCSILCRAGADSLIPICNRLPVRIRFVPLRGPCQAIARGVGSRPSQAACNFACDAIQGLADQL